MYLGDALEQYITHPYASPLFGKFDGLPPMLIQCGDAEVLHDEIVLLSHKASLAGVQVQLETYEDAVSSLIFSFIALIIGFSRFMFFKHFLSWTLRQLPSSLAANLCGTGYPTSNATRLRF